MAVCNGLAHVEILGFGSLSHALHPRRSWRGVRDVTSQRMSSLEATNGPVFNEIGQ